MHRASSILLIGQLFQSVCLPEDSTFDVASVKVVGSGVPKVPLYEGSADPGRLHLRLNMSLLLTAAFGANADQIKGPPWLRDFSAMPFYDIAATMPDKSDKAIVEQMLQNLLIERFHLTFHREMVNYPGYELVVDTGGPKMKQVSADLKPADDPPAIKSGSMGPDGFPSVPGPRIMAGRREAARQRIKIQEWSMTSFAAQLGFMIGRAQGISVDTSLQPRVVNKTDLPGVYTFILEYDCPACVPLTTASANTPAASQGTPPAANEPGDFPDLFGAIRKELGLRLIKTADVPEHVIVVEAVDKLPTDN